MIRAYAVRPADSPPLESTAVGVDAAPLWSVTAGHVAAVVSSHADETAVPTREHTILEHASVVEAAHRKGPVLPVRFGATFESEELLRRALQAQHDGLVDGLERVAGHVEYGLRVAATEGGAPRSAADRPRAAAGSSGRRYLERVASYEQSVDARTAAATDTAEAIHAVVGGQATDRWLGSTPPAGLLAVIAYLVPCEQAGAFEEAVACVPPQHPALTVTCTGPWPPYSFAPRGGGLTS